MGVARFVAFGTQSAGVEKGRIQAFKNVMTSVHGILTRKNVPATDCVESIVPDLEMRNLYARVSHRR